MCRIVNCVPHTVFVVPFVFSFKGKLCLMHTHRSTEVEASPLLSLISIRNPFCVHVHVS